MFTRSVARAGTQSLRTITRSTRPISSQASSTLRSTITTQSRFAVASKWRPFSSSAYRFGIMPESSDPAPKQAEHHEKVTQATDISLEEYHERSDQYMEELLTKLEEMADQRSDLEVEYSAGVLSVEVPQKGTYVLNKQPPNKQIWLSSPITGPKRYDWVLLGESMYHKEGGGGGDWIYLRDNSSLTDLLRKELGVSLGRDDSIGSKSI